MRILCHCIIIIIGLSISSISYAKQSRCLFYFHDSVAVANTLKDNNTLQHLATKYKMPPQNSMFTIIFELYHGALNAYQDKHYERARLHATKLITFGLSYKLYELLNDMDILLLNIAYNEGNYVQAQNYVQNIINKKSFSSLSIHNKCLVYNIFYNVLWLNNKHDELISLAKQAILQAISDNDTLSIFYHTIRLIEVGTIIKDSDSTLHHIKGALLALDYDISYIDYKNNLEAIRAANDPLLYTLIATIACMKNDTKYSEHFYIEALKILNQPDQDHDIYVTILSHASFMLLDKPETDTSYRLAVLYLNNIEFSEDYYNVVYAYYLIGQNYANDMQYVEACDMLEQAYNMLNNQHNPALKLFISRNIVTISQKGDLDYTENYQNKIAIYLNKIKRMETKDDSVL